MLSRTSKKVEKTRKLIIETSMEMFKTDGVDNISMAAIAERCDIAKGTLYNHFKCKEAIIAGYMQLNFSSSDFYINSEELLTTRDRLQAILSLLSKSIKEHQDIFEKYLVYQMQHMVSFDQDETFESGFRNIGNFIIDKGIESGELREDLPRAVLREFFEFIFIEVVKQQYKNGQVDQSLLDRHIDLFLNGATIVD